jgi:uncharacterized membrane protein YcjF (UPF0283 family)
MKKTIEQKKLTLEEYQQKYSNSENVAAAKTFLFILSAAIGIAIATSLSFVVLRLFEIHQIAGYVGSIVAIIIFIVLYIVPVVKLKNTKSFLTNVDATNARQAQKYNKQLRAEIADKMIDINAKAEVNGWYSDDLVGKLAIARVTKNDQELKDVLTKIYQTDVKNASNKMIRTSAVRVGVATAISQSEAIDTLFVLVYELNLIKDIVYLYGYRPTDSQMVKIYKNVLTNALIAYGISGATGSVGKSVGSGIISALEKASQSGNFLTSTIGTVAGIAIDSGLQFVVNASLTIRIGYQTKKYLIKEYNLQEMLDNIELSESDDEEAKMIESISKEVREQMSKKTKSDKSNISTS